MSTTFEKVMVFGSEGKVSLLLTEDFLGLVFAFLWAVTIISSFCWSSLVGLTWQFDSAMGIIATCFFKDCL